ncbi:uncharacterized protein [Epargyreus clarus]|uniref:uncharacterized protein n=1 Tax=Epargyreus clarus TaxID=520877 RepID=UPI003C2E71B0
MLNTFVKVASRYKISINLFAYREHDIWETDPQGLYGLKPEYLKSLNITPPIGKWVHVTNFRCDKSELRDAFELAGTVVACSIINTTNKYAKIMYSHPLEAIQAISMLHNQVFYGQRLNIVMDKTANSERVLPKGLLSIGPGLGEDGYGVREIAKEYERFLEGKSTSINLSLFKNGNVDEIVIPKNMGHSVLGVDKVLISEFNAQVSRTSPQLPKASSPNGPPGVDPVMDKPVSEPLGPKGRLAGPQDSGQYGNRSPGPVFRAPMPRGPGPVAPGGPMAPGGSMAAGGSTAPGGPMAPGSSMGPRADLYPPGQFPRGYLPPNRMPMQYLQNLSGPVPNLPLSAPVQSIASNWPGPYNAGLMTRMLKTGDPNTLKIINLPPTTSFPSLCAKLSTLAQVTSLEFTTPGCAVVRFVSPGDTEKCFQSYRNIQLS